MVFPKKTVARPALVGLFFEFQDIGRLSEVCQLVVFSGFFWNLMDWFSVCWVFVENPGIPTSNPMKNNVMR